MDNLFQNDTDYNNKLPPQYLSFSKKNKKWRKAHLDWADSKTFFNYSPVRNSAIHKKINYDLVNGKIHMQDIELVLNPEQIDRKMSPENIQHYDVIGAKLNVLRGEESARLFDYRVVVTNANAISERETQKRDLIYQQLQQMVQAQSESEEQYQQNLQSMSDYFTYEWQDMREIRANALLNHYVKEYNMPLMFNKGFMDAMIVGEEIYQCDIVGGEPFVQKLNPLDVRVFKSGLSNKIEDASIVIIENYMSPAQIRDMYYDVLTKKDIEYIEKSPTSIDSGTVDDVGEVDERYGFVNGHMLDDVITTKDFYFDPFNLFGSAANDLMPFDVNGNVRVIRMYWKSVRKIKKVKSYDPETGEEQFDFYPETYVIDEAMGEEEETMFINEAWEGTKIGEKVYVNIRPRPIQYNRLSNPSRCHFGIIGSIYNLNDSKPFSMVDRMKPYAYLYDVIHDRLNKVIARNWGKLIKLDLAKVPKGWDIDKWLYYAQHTNLVVEDSFNEGDRGAALGKIAGAMNNASSGVVDAELGQVIQGYLQILEYIKNDLAETVGISKQREGQISNRETVGGVERATLQSSHITEWLFITHDDVKKRVLECFLETAKIALRGRKEKFNYILSDGSLRVSEIDGDEFAEADYGLIVDNSEGMQKLQQQLEGLAQAALQNQLLKFSSLMKLYTSTSLIEKQRLIERDERETREQQQQTQQQQLQAQQEAAQQQAQLEEAKLQQQDVANQRDNETKILVANITASNNTWIEERKLENKSEEKINQLKLDEQIREFNEKMKLEKEKLQHQDKWHKKTNNTK